MHPRSIVRMQLIRAVGKAFVAMALLPLSSCLRKAPSGDYDMVAVSVTIDPVQVHVGDKVIFNHLVRNDGKHTVPARTYHVDLYLDGNRIAFDHGPLDMSPGSSSTYGMSAGNHHWQPTKPGKYRYRLVVDEANNLPETNESNNILEGDIEVLP